MSAVSHSNTDLEPDERKALVGQPVPRVNPGVGEGSEFQGVSYSWDDHPRDLGRARALKDQSLVRAQLALAVACDPQHGTETERSNAFDLWKALLLETSQNALKRGSHFRQVLGAVLVAVYKRDLCDFSVSDLGALKTATNILHSPSVVPSDVARALRALKGLSTVLPLAVAGADDSPEADEEAAAVISAMITRHKQ